MATMRTIGVRLRMDTTEYQRDSEKAKQSTEEVGKSSKKTKKDLEELAGSMALVGGAMVAAAGVVVFATARFDKQMSEVKAVAGATAEEFGALRDAAIEAGAATAFSASEAAQAEAELAKAGVSVADILGGGLSGALDLAAAGTLELSEAATIAAQAMNIFGLSGSDVGHIADVLAAAANKSATGVSELGIGLQQVGLVANQVGFGLEETVGLLAAFADNALGGSDGATSLKTALLRLAAPLPEARRVMDQYGISLYDANGHMVDAVTIAGQLQRGLGGLADAERNAALMAIFGQDAIRAGNVLIGEGADGIREYIRAVNDQGAATDVAAQKLDNLAGDAEQLSGSLETLFIKSGGVNSVLRGITQAASEGINVIGGLPGPILAVGTGVVALTGFVLLGTAAQIKFAAAVDRTAISLASMGRAGTIAATGVRAVTAAAGPALLAVTAFWTAYEFVPDHGAWEKAAAVTGGVGLAFQRIQTAAPDTYKGISRVAVATGESAAAAVAATEWNKALGGAFGEAANEADGLKAAFDRLNGATLTQREAMRNAEAAVDDLQEALAESNGSMDITTEKGRAAQEAVDELAVAAGVAAQATYDQTHSVAAANDAYQRYIDQLRTILREAGYSEQQVDDLVSSIAEMPAYKATTIEVNAKVNLTGGKTGIKLPNLPIFQAEGGVTFAANGLIRQGQAGIASQPVVWAEAGTEAYVPQGGDRGRALSVLRTAADWHGAAVVPREAMHGTASTGGGTTVVLQVSPRVGASRDVMSAITDGLRFDTASTANASVQQNYGRRGRV